MKTPKRVLSAVLLSGAAFAASATPAHALAGIGETGGPFAFLGLGAASLISGQDLSVPDTNKMVQQAKEQHAKDQQAKEQQKQQGQH
ncbi:hypothetical protein [Saccharothrix sp. ST-888]|uniref:hypothetical protein n=1 Tax=Saccharothrix sp. ST-888 TaxID=1427391 RepID=UPI0005EC7EAE|nr:hypothetical protein [Saccharothrix sp. ST-888]KJK56200.1 hypothetical protein UK12_24165 [Saccharothrix sp. ST-888]